MALMLGSSRIVSPSPLWTAAKSRSFSSAWCEHASRRVPTREAGAYIACIAWQAVASACQVLFMISRAPRVPWEAIYLPATEALSYGLSFYGEGYIRLATGKVLPWCRMAAWL